MTGQSMRALRKRARHRDATAILELGFRYDTGRGVRENPTKAVGLFQQAANLGNPAAQSRMGVIRSRGEYGFTCDTEKAFGVFRSTAAQGDLVGQINLAHAYDYGLQVERDLKKAAEIYALLLGQHIESVLARDFSKIRGLGKHKILEMAATRLTKILKELEEQAEQSLSPREEFRGAKSPIKSIVIRNRVRPRTTDDPTPAAA